MTDTLHPLAAWRWENHLSQRELASLIGMTEARLSLILTYRAMPTLGQTLRIAAVTGGKVPPSTWNYKVQNDPRS